MVADTNERMGQYLDSLVDPMAATPKETRSSGTGSSNGLGVFRSIRNRSHHSSQVTVESLGAQRIVIDPADAAHVPYAPMLEVVDEGLYMDDEIATNVDDDAPQTFEVDLVSAIIGYRQNPNECFAHLVAAALSTRSEEYPVVAEELFHAKGSPFLTRMIVDSDVLDVGDPVVHEYIQEVVDGLIHVEDPDINPSLHEYLSSFFRLPFVRINYEQYALLKESGFEYLCLLKKYKHVPPRGYIIFLGLLEGNPAALVAAIVSMVVSLLVEVFCTVTFGLVLGHWMNLTNTGTDGFSGQSYGFYTLIVYGCGFAAYLICVTLTLQNRPDESSYEELYSVPSPYANVVPVIPLFDILSIMEMVDAYRRRLTISCHNILNISCAASVFYSCCFGWPQYIAQSYFNFTLLDVPQSERMNYSFKLLRAAALLQWCVAIIRLLGNYFFTASVNAVGFADFNIRLPAHRVVLSKTFNLLNFLSLFVMESNVYLLVASCIMTANFAECDHLPPIIAGLSGGTVVLLAIEYLLLIFSPLRSIHLGFFHLPVVGLQVAVLILSEADYSECGIYRHLVFREGFIFGYVSLAAYLSVFVFSLVVLLVTVIGRVSGVNYMNQNSYPCLRRRAERKRQEEKEQEMAATQGRHSASASTDMGSDSRTSVSS
ncbi:hypothetical protein AGDE_08088 [Angomonas deanei]|uniref:Uncharacterized protein n=1 Tax=Angomonas deanei TaxID=59799 RepID=A0A7G2C9B2_9TRYP|nr:hypothetical protein AGDE_08088 [Angomonas deanei]CAD2215644.1 hypothetical protein, conserved [Angomonas deanei]|eukprot:EPY34004.1 hypothetical protein AGDE_08088 [Angomonas deanei]